MSRERPILFSAPMVRAILDGRKTQTRRVMNPQPYVKDRSILLMEMNGKDYYATGEARYTAAPFSVGMILWVRETFAIESNCGVESSDAYPPPFKDGRPVRWQDDPDLGRFWEQCHYRATEPTHSLVTEEGSEDDTGKWRPSIFMPRWASRLTLEVTGVRVERMQEISEEDAKAEGVVVGEWVPTRIICDSTAIGGKVEKSHGKLMDFTARGAFCHLWDSINGPRGYGWSSNPWVWVVSFRRVTP